MGTAEFAAFVEQALFLDRDDPGAAWRRAARLPGAADRDGSRRPRELRIEAEGTDLTLNVEGRTWINSDGKRNMPSGEVFTGPHESSAEGRIRFTIPSGPAASRSRGSSSSSARARVVSRPRRARRGVPEGDAGHRRRRLAGSGEIGIGTNFGIDRPVGAILFDEKIGGTVHLAVGRSYPGDRRHQRVSAVHWDMICDLRRGGR